MRTTTPRFYLRADEHVVLAASPAPGAAVVRFVREALLASFALGGVLVFARFGPLDVPPVAVTAAWGAYVLLLVVSALVAWRWWATTEYVITDARIHARTGRLRTSVHFTTHDKVTDIQYHQGVLDRLASVSRVTFMTAGGDVTVAGVANALEVKETAESAREAFVEALLERAGVEEAARRERTAVRAPPAPVAARDAVADEEAPAVPAPEPLPSAEGEAPDYVKKGDRVLWNGAPRLIASVGTSVRTLVGVAFVAFATAGNPATWFVLPLAVAGAAALVGWRALQLKHTEYVVSDQRVYVRSGVVGTTVKQLTYAKITDITYSQDVFGRVLGYAGVTVNTAGSNEAPVVMVGLWDAIDVKELVEKARARALHEDGEDAA